MPSKRATYSTWFGLNILLTFYCVLLLSTTAQARTKRHVLIIQYGDSHSRYDRIVPFLAMIRKRIATFKRDFPKGDVIILASGDISARSAFSDDMGWMNIRVLHHLSRLYPAAWVQGNHEALDWRGPRGRKLYIDQMKFIHQGRPSHLGVHALSANLKPATVFEPFLIPYRVIPIQGGAKTLRIIGLTLDDYFKRAVYDPLVEPQLFTGINPIKMELPQQLEQAGRDGVDWVIPAFHEEFSPVRGLAQQVATWRATKPLLQTYKVPAIFAADDHLEMESIEGGIPVFDSGCEYVYRAVELNRDGEVVGKEMYRSQDLNRAERRDLSNHLLREDFEFIREHVNPTLSEARKNHARSLGVYYGTTDTRKDFKSRRTELGTLIADAFQLYGEQVILKEQSQYAGKPVVALFNSSTYRKEDGIKGGELTKGDIVAMAPYFESPSLFIATGAQFQKLYASLRTYRMLEGVYSPQLSGNLIESPIEGQPFRLLYQAPDSDTWIPVAEIEELTLVAEHWLSENGYQLKEWTEILPDLAVIQPQEALLEVDILEQNLPIAIRRGKARAQKLCEPTCSQQIKLHTPQETKSQAG